jgi:dolichyl-phosphate-mannose--protein O-mannosyl transferase
MDAERRGTARGRLYVQIATVFPVSFLLVPLVVYALSYTVWVAQGGGVVEAIEQNKAAYNFHSSLTAEHGSQSSFWEWPIMSRPIYLHVGATNPTEKIYSMGNPWVFWLGIPALVFALFQVIRTWRASVSESGTLKVWGDIRPGQAAIWFVVMGYLALWLPWALDPRTLFLYHYLPALAFMIMAMGYCIHWLWRNNIHMEIVVGTAAACTAMTLNRLGAAGTVPDFIQYGMIGVGVFGLAAIIIGIIKHFQGQEPGPSPLQSFHWGQILAMGSLALFAGTFVYFYPHMTAIDVSNAVDRSYFWFDSWR